MKISGKINDRKMEIGKVSILSCPRYFVVTDPRGEIRRYGLYSYDRIISEPAFEATKDISLDRFNPRARHVLRDWYFQKAKKIASNIFHDFWVQSIEKADQTSALLQRKYYSVTRDQSSYLMLHPHIGKFSKHDLLKYKAAHFALFHKEREHFNTLNGRYSPYQDKKLPSDIMENWREFFGNLNKAKNITIDNLHGWVPLMLSFYFMYVDLDRPIFGYWETMAAVLAGYNKLDVTRYNFPDVTGMLLRASDDDVRRSMKAFLESRRITTGSRIKTNLWVSFMNFLTDYGDEKKNLYNTTIESIRWHRDAALKAKTSNYTEFIFPKILPKVEEKFIYLADTNALIEESANMDHCVGALFQRAIDGQSAFFHYVGGATLEVNPITGKIYQCYGYRNAKNKKALEAERLWQKSIK